MRLLVQVTYTQGPRPRPLRPLHDGRHAQRIQQSAETARRPPVLHRHDHFLRGRGEGEDVGWVGDDLDLGWPERTGSGAAGEGIETGGAAAGGGVVVDYMADVVDLGIGGLDDGLNGGRGVGRMGDMRGRDGGDVGRVVVQDSVGGEAGLVLGAGEVEGGGGGERGEG